MAWEVNITAIELLNSLKSSKKKLISEGKILDKKDKNIYPVPNPPFEIPEDWVWCYLSDMSVIQEGPGIRKHQYNDEGIQFLTVTNIIEDYVDLKKSKKYISVDEYNKKYKHFTINKGDIVTACSGASWGKSAIYEQDELLILNTSTLRLRFYNDLGENRYLYYLTKAIFFKSNLSKYSTGQQDNYGYFHYSKIPIPLPPLAEQKRIVANLDEAFSAISTAKENAEENLKNAKELFESYLNNIFEKKGKDWEEKKLGKVCKDIFAGGDAPKSNFSKEKNDNHKIPIYANAVKDKGLYGFTDVFRVSEPSITISARGSGTGHTEIRYDDYLPIVRLIVIIPDLKITSLEFFKHSIDNLKILRSGSAIPQLTVPMIKEYPIPLPPLKEQQRIVAKLDALSDQTKKLEAVYTKKIADLDELKKSILQKAFRGEL